MKSFTILQILLYSLLLIACYKESDYEITEINVDEVILKVTSQYDTILANGQSTTKILVEIPVNTEESKTEVKVKASNGVFQSNKESTASKKAKLIKDNSDIKRIAEFVLQSSNKAGASNIEIEVDDFKKEYNVYFKHNYPDHLQIIPSKLILNPHNGEEVEIKVVIGSDNGLPSIGQVVNLIATDTVFNLIGTFRTYIDKSNISGETSYSYTLLPDTTYLGRIVFVSSTFNNAIQITGTTYIYAKN